MFLSKTKSDSKSKDVIQAQSSEQSSVKTPFSKQHTLHVFANKNKLFKSTSHEAQQITQQIAKFLVKGLHPYNMIDNIEFRSLLSMLQPRYSVPSRKQFAEVIVPKLYQEVKDEVTSKIQKAVQVSLTTDGWTSRATDDYVTVTSSLVNDDWKLETFVLQTRPLGESHTADNLAEVLREVVTEWKVGDGNGPPTIVTDNAANIVKAVQLMEAPHMPCFAHTLNISVQKALKVKRTSHVLAKVRRIAAFFHRSAKASTLLKSKALLLGLPCHKLVIDVVTRWNSSYDMLSRYLEMQLAVITTMRSKELGSTKDFQTITDDDLNLMEELVSFLQPIKEITVLLCFESCPTISIIQPIRYQLLQSVLLSREDDSPPIKEMKRVMVDDFSGRYTLQKDMLSLASSVDPRFKSLPYLNPEERFDVYGKLTTKVATVWDFHMQNLKVKREPEEVTVNEPPLPQLPDDTAEMQVGLDLDGNVSVKTEETFPARSVELDSNIEDKDCLLEDLLGDVFYITSEPAKSSLELAQAEIASTRMSFHLLLGRIH